MKVALYLAALAAVVCSVYSIYTPPKIQVYSHNLGVYGKENTLMCHVSNFHPPDITIQLLKEGVEIPNAEMTDLFSNDKWQFHLTKSVNFTPMEGEMYICRVNHSSIVKDYAWESKM